jgi:hypothetical protein
MRHGTTTGYQYHKCRCDLCRQAANEAMRRWRHGNSVAAGRDRAQARAYYVALNALRDRHPTEFKALYADAKRRRGLSAEPET